MMLIASFYSFNAASVEFRIAQAAAITLQLDSSMLVLLSQVFKDSLLFTLCPGALRSKVNSQRLGDAGYTRLISSRASTLEGVFH